MNYSMNLFSTLKWASTSKERERKDQRKRNTGRFGRSSSNMYRTVRIRCRWVRSSTDMQPFPLGLESGVKLGDGHRAALLIQNPNSFRCVTAGVHCGLVLRDEKHELRPLPPHLKVQRDNMN